jgi:hypothetical protein
MAGSVNKVILVGNLGADPEVKSMQSGDEVCNLSIATSESWNDKASGERKEKTHWHRVVIFNPNLVKVAKSYLKKTACNTHTERLHELATMQYFRRYSSGLLTAVNFAKHKR